MSEESKKLAEHQKMINIIGVVIAPFTMLLAFCLHSIFVEGPAFAPFLEPGPLLLGATALSVIAILVCFSQVISASRSMRQWRDEQRTHNK